MSDDVFDLEDENAGPKGLRDHAKALEKQLAELREQNQKLASEHRGRSVSDALREHGADPALAEFYQNDDASPDAVLKWLESKGKLFGWEASMEKTPEQVQTEHAAAQITAASNSAPSGDGPDLMTMLRTYPAEKLVEMKIIPPKPQ